MQMKLVVVVVAYHYIAVGEASMSSKSIPKVDLSDLPKRRGGSRPSDRDGDGGEVIQTLI